MADWLWQGVLLAVIAIAMEGTKKHLDKHLPEWGDHILNVVRNLAFLCIIFYVVTGHSLVYKPPSTTTSANVQSRIMEWARSMGQSAVQDKEQVSIGFYDRNVKISRHGDEFLTVAYYINFTTIQKSTFENFTDDQKKSLDHTVRVQVSRLGLQNHRIVDNGYLDGYKDVPITEALTKENFLEAVGQVQRSAIIMEETLDKDLQEIKRQR